MFCIKNHEDLSFRLNPSTYIMSMMVQKLIPYPLEISKELQLRTRIPDRLIDQLELHAAQSIIMPLVTKEYKKENSISDEKIEQFMEICVRITETLLRKYNLDYLTKLNLDVYQASIDYVKKQNWLSIGEQKQAIEIIDILNDYSVSITPIILSGDKIIMSAFEEIDVKDLLKSLYGTLLSFVCIMITLSPQFRNKNRFSAFVRQGYEFAKNVDGYIDTLDILTNPDERELIENSD